MVAQTGELWSVRRHWADFAGAISDDIRGFSWSSPRLPRAFSTGLAVALAVWVAILLDLDFPMWSGMTAFTVTQGSLVATTVKGVLRILGTMLGALAGAFLISFIAGNHIELAIALFLTMTVALYRTYVSRFMYAWLLGGITAGLVLLTTMADPYAGLHAAAYRAAEISVGVAVAWLVGRLFLPRTLGARADFALMDQPKLSSRRQAWLAALEGGFGIVLVVVLYDFFDLPGFESGTVSLTRVADPDPQIGRHRGFLRLIGCTVGGSVGLVLVWFNIDFLPTMLVLMFVVCSVFGYFGSGSTKNAYAGMQAAFAFLIAFAASTAPTTTLDPAIDRLAGIVLALFVFWIMDWLIDSAALADKGIGAETERQP
jgi:uncharacterized membrane protein YccC